MHDDLLEPRFSHAVALRLERLGNEDGGARNLCGARLEGQSLASCRAGGATQAGLKHQIVTYPDVDHAFFNPTSSRYDRGAATAAYRRMIGWFDKYVAT